MRIVALGQQKGGTSKSCTVINLACQAVAAGKKAAIIDMDSEQGTAKKWGARRNGLDSPTVRTADIIGLPKVLSELEAEGYDWAFLDLPGRSAPISGAGLAASDMVIIPCRPLDVDIEASITTVRGVRGMKKPYCYLLSIVPAQHEHNRAKQMSGTLQALGHPVAPMLIIQRVVVPDAVAEGKGVNEVKGGTSSSKEFAELFEWLDQQVKK